MSIERIDLVKAQDIPLKIRTTNGIDKGFAEIRVTNSVRQIVVKKIDKRLSIAFKDIVESSGAKDMVLF